jgi:hypothetical protein
MEGVWARMDWGKRDQRERGRGELRYFWGKARIDWQKGSMRVLRRKGTSGC